MCKIDNNIIYKFKAPHIRAIFLSEDYIEFQDFIRENRIGIGMYIVEKWAVFNTPIKHGIIVFDIHLRNSLSFWEAKWLKDSNYIWPIILIGHPVFLEGELANKYFDGYDIYNFSEET